MSGFATELIISNRNLIINDKSIPEISFDLKLIYFTIALVLILCIGLNQSNPNFIPSITFSKILERRE
jgi:hypothetical protein